MLASNVRLLQALIQKVWYLLRACLAICMATTIFGGGNDDTKHVTSLSGEEVLDVSDCPILCCSTHVQIHVSRNAINSRTLYAWGCQW
jgi:hypothetical protein